VKLTVLTPGKIKESWLKAGIEEYRKRLARYCTVVVETVADKPDSWPARQAVDAEGALILQRISPQTFVVALDLAGTPMDSQQFAAGLRLWLERGGSSLTFVIGGSNGLAQSVLERAQVRLCLSAMTLTHQMARLFLLEQCYRAFRITAGEPYHK
jgi:23S rRNA (pseudouridine1915-N3)-methyltransferase